MGFASVSTSGQYSTLDCLFLLKINMLTVDYHDSLEERVRQNVKLVKESPHIRKELKERTKGLIYDIKTGKLTEFD